MENIVCPLGIKVIDLLKNAFGFLIDGNLAIHVQEIGGIWQALK